MREKKMLLEGSDQNNFAAMYYHMNKFKYNLDAYTDDEDPDKI